MEVHGLNGGFFMIFAARNMCISFNLMDFDGIPSMDFH